MITKTTEELKLKIISNLEDVFQYDINDCPFYAGFGNKESDFNAYIKGGIPENNIFIINEEGFIKRGLT